MSLPKKNFLFFFLGDSHCIVFTAFMMNVVGMEKVTPRLQMMTSIQSGYVTWCI